MTSMQNANPLLVQLYDTHRLYRMAEDKTPEARRDLCETVTGLLTTDLRPAEKELVADILISLIRQSERDLKQALADRLAVMDSVPLRLVLQLANDEIDVAEPVLRHSKILNDLDLLYIIQSRTAPYWRVIAAREDLNEDVIDSLAETRDVGTAKVLVANQAVRLTTHAVDILGDLGAADDEIARPLLSRTDVPEEVARKLYAYVADDLREKIRSVYHVVPDIVMETVEDVIQEFTTDPSGDVDSVWRPTPAMVRAAHMFSEKGHLTPLLMVRTLKRGQGASFMAQFAEFSRLPVAVLSSIFQQKNGQGLAVICKARNVNREDFTALFLLTRRIARTDGIVDHKDLVRALTYYDRISKVLAERIMKKSCH